MSFSWLVNNNSNDIFPFTVRNDFRAAYSKLNILGTFMPNPSILALTATATAFYQKETKRSDAKCLWKPTQAGKSYSTTLYPGGNRGDRKLIEVIKAFEAKIMATSLKIVYSNLKTCGRGTN